MKLSDLIKAFNEKKAMLDFFKTDYCADFFSKVLSDVAWFGDSNYKHFIQKELNPKFWF